MEACEGGEVEEDGNKLILRGRKVREEPLKYTSLLNLFHFRECRREKGTKDPVNQLNYSVTFFSSSSPFNLLPLHHHFSGRKKYDITERTHLFASISRKALAPPIQHFLFLSKLFRFFCHSPFHSYTKFPNKQMIFKITPNLIVSWIKLDLHIKGTIPFYYSFHFPRSVLPSLVTHSIASIFLSFCTHNTVSSPFSSSPSFDPSSESSQEWFSECLFSSLLLLIQCTVPAE